MFVVVGYAEVVVVEVVVVAVVVVVVFDKKTDLRGRSFAVGSFEDGCFGEADDGLLFASFGLGSERYVGHWIGSDYLMVEVFFSSLPLLELVLEISKKKREIS